MRLPVPGTAGNHPGTIASDGSYTLKSSLYGGAIVERVFSGDFTTVVSFTSTTPTVPDSYKYVVCGVASKVGISFSDFVYNASGEPFPTSVGSVFPNCSVPWSWYNSNWGPNGNSISIAGLSYFRFQRIANTITLHYSPSPTGPWSTLIRTGTVTAGHAVLCCIGDAVGLATYTRIARCVSVSEP
jgi:hypothetical protein